MLAVHRSKPAAELIRRCNVFLPVCSQTMPATVADAETWRGRRDGRIGIYHMAGHSCLQIRHRASSSLCYLLVSVQRKESRNLELVRRLCRDVQFGQACKSDIEPILLCLVYWFSSSGRHLKPVWRCYASAAVDSGISNQG